MRTESDPFRCPAEDAIEIWAIQDVLGVPDNEERLHLITCPLCHDLHTRFVDFYCTITQEANEYLVARQAGTANTISILEEEVKTESRLLRPLDNIDERTCRPLPVAISAMLLSGLGREKLSGNAFISADGTIIGKFLKLTGTTDWLFQLLSPDTSTIGRSVFCLNDERPYVQSNDQGVSRLSLGDHTPAEIESIELLPFIYETVFDPAVFTCEPGQIPGVVKIDAGPLGEIILEQEEGDRGEPILHVLLTGMPRSFFKKRVVVALETDRLPPLVEEAVGCNIYYYEVDLFRSLRLWVYLR